MEAKDTARKIGELCPMTDNEKFQCVHGSSGYREPWGIFDRTRRLSAEISFKAGEEQEHNFMIGIAVDEGNKAFVNGRQAGRKEVVEFIKRTRQTPLGEDCYGYYVWECSLEVQLKEWGL